MTTKSKKKWNPTRVLTAIDNVLEKNEILQKIVTSRDEQIARDGLAMRRVIAENEDLRARLKASEEAGQKHYRVVQDLQAQLRAADETAGKALADAKRARDSQGVVWLVKFCAPSSLPYLSFVTATKDDALLKVSKIYLKTKVIDNGGRVQVFNNDAEAAFAGEYTLQQAKIVHPG